jgi:hypothetical protein
MDELRQFKEKAINDYISQNLDFDRPENINPKQISLDLKKIIHEEPGIKLNYRSDDIIVEGGSSKRIEQLESITVVFTYDVQQPDGLGGYIDVPIPVEKEFLIS